ncbi:3-oxo-5-alpha-steroid 4-dehydrogenase 1 isoform X2 [Ornithorhynchus anatinus]|uniref:3-oxo-5-alpha-steroid 4-dehydrogenase n=1 Tax=Ornithorhynchus anatinus TaxID=9258 RepID=A0A6I8NGS6_ORNAN|nr:3-oxo-5-alpha-steroid 4-dehydrogenase 1 isoform X2 [Ornithorhynchus anatinus]
MGCERGLLRALSWTLLGAAALLWPLRRRTGGRRWAPYGRHGGRGRSVPARAAWALQELPSVLVPLGLALRNRHRRLPHWPNRLLLAMFLLHYLHRSLVFPFLIRGGKPTPVSTFIMAFLFCSFNGYLQGQNLSKYAVYPTSWLRNPRFIIGFLLWLIGMLINIHSDHILRNLRKPGETGYKIPRGGLFEYVSGANFFGEIVEWYGYALASWSVEGAAFATFSASFLINRAQLHHRWYLEKFEDYPKLRKILIPFLF